MSSSPLLTITEWHGFRVLAAAMIAFIGALRMLAHGLRNFAPSRRPFYVSDESLSLWLRIRSMNDALSRRVPVLCFDDGRGREGPIFGAPCLQPLSIVCDPNRSILTPLASHRREPRFGWPDQHTEF